MSTRSPGAADGARHPFRLFIGRHWRLLSLLTADLLLLPALFLCERLSVYMLAQNGICDWARVGAKCGTCGGTRCVHNLLHGNLAQAFELNPFVFCGAVYVALSFLLLHLSWLCRARWAEWALRRMYSLTALLTIVIAYVLFTVARNIPFFIYAIDYIATHT